MPPNFMHHHMGNMRLHPQQDHTGLVHQQNMLQQRQGPNPSLQVNQPGLSSIGGPDTTEQAYINHNQQAYIYQNNANYLYGAPVNNFSNFNQNNIQGNK